MRMSLIIVASSILLASLLARVHRLEADTTQPTSQLGEHIKAVWEKDLGEAGRILVLRDVARDQEVAVDATSVSLSSVRYTFLLLTHRQNELKSRVLWQSHRSLSIAGTESPIISILNADFKDELLLVIFNERGRCWANLVPIILGGSSDTVPRLKGRIALGDELSVSEAAQSAEIRWREAGPPRIVLHYSKAKSIEFAIAQDDHGARWQATNAKNEQR